MKIFIFIIGFILSILVSSFVSITPLVAVLLLLIGGSILLSEKIYNKKISAEIFYLSLVIISFGIGILRYDIKDFHEGTFDNKVGEKVELIGVVISEPEKRESDTRFVFKSNGEKILVSTDLYSEIYYGDELKVSGKLKEPGVIDGEGGRQFGYAKYLSKDDIYYTINYAKFEKISTGNGNALMRALLSIKNKFVTQTRKILSEPQSSLLSGLVISGKDALPKNVLEDFRKAGVMHIVVLSGFNITVIAKFIAALFASIFFIFKSRKVWIPKALSVIGIILFVLMAGATPSIIRAGLMAFVAIGGMLIGRQYNVTRALFLAAFLMLLWNPKILFFDPSFQLSFLATVGMIYFTPIIEKYLSKVPGKLGLREIISITIATQLTVMPFIIYTMGNVSLVSLVSNLLILPLVPLTMLVGFLATIVSYTTSFFALPLTYISHILLSWIIFVAHHLGNMKYASISIEAFPFILVLVCYAGLAMWFVRSQNYLRRIAS